MKKILKTSFFFQIFNKKLKRFFPAKPPSRYKKSTTKLPNPTPKKEPLPRRTITIPLPHVSWKGITFILINVVLLSLYLWSKPGSTTKARIEVTGQNYKAYVDEYFVKEGTIPEFPRGGIGFTQLQKNFVPSIPLQQAIDSVKVTDYHTGEILFYDDFSTPNPMWKNEQQAWYIDERGMYTTDKRYTKTTTGYQDWEDYILEAEINSCLNIDIYLRVQDLNNLVVFSFSPWRDLNSVLYYYQDGKFHEPMPGGPGLKQINNTEAIRAIVATILYSYPYALFFIILITALGFLVWKVAAVLKIKVKQTRKKQPANNHALFWNIALCVLIVVAFGEFYYITSTLLERIPHVPDAIAYSLQAKMFAEGNLYASAPPFPEHFTFPGSLIITDGKWFSQYPFGHPFVLMWGFIIGKPWLIPPLIGTLSLIFIYLIGKEIHSHRVGFFTALLAFSSPFYQMNAANFMSHNTALFYVVVCTYCFVKTVKNRHWLYALLGGIALGFLFNTRPLTAVVISIPFILFALIDLVVQRKKIFKVFLSYVPMIVGFSLLFLAFLLYNYALTGDFLTTPYKLGGTAIANNLGFSDAHPLGRALLDFYTNLSLLLIVIFGWTKEWTILFIIAMGMLLVSRKWEYLFFAAAIAIPLGYLYYNGNYIMYGPRFWYEAIPFFFLLTCLAIEKIPEGIQNILLLVEKKTHTVSVTAVSKTPILLLCYGITIVLMVQNLNFWFFKKQSRWPDITYTPSSITELKGFNSANRNLINAIEKSNIHQAVIFIEKGNSNWWNYGIPLYHMSPSLVSDIIYVIDLGDEKNKRLMELYPERTFYKAEYNQARVTPYQV